MEGEVDGGLLFAQSSLRASNLHRFYEFGTSFASSLDVVCNTASAGILSRLTGAAQGLSDRMDIPVNVATRNFIAHNLDLAMTSGGLLLTVGCHRDVHRTGQHT